MTTDGGNTTGRAQAPLSEAGSPTARTQMPSPGAGSSAAHAQLPSPGAGSSAAHAQAPSPGAGGSVSGAQASSPDVGGSVPRPHTPSPDAGTLGTLSPDELNALVQRQFPDYAACRVTDASGTHLLMEADGARLRTRPGGTISGPEQAGLVDLAAFLLINARLGRPTPMALTTSLQISYLNRPRPGLLRTHARMAKFGRRLCVVLAELRDEAGDLAASATVTYSVPPTTAGQGTG